MDEQATYDAANRALLESGLTYRLVFETPRWETAVEAVRRCWEEGGRTWMSMGPARGDRWTDWLHIQSHSLMDVSGHSLEHARLELRFVQAVIAALDR